MRIRGATTELQEAGLETDGMAESTAKLRQEILALSGVDIMLDPNTFKSTYQIMDELSQKWEGLSDIAQASITELMAGKHQGNIMSSLMSNFDTARKALETSQNSAGSAMAEHAKWSDSLEARLNKLKATWQSLSQSFMSSSFLKGGISALTGFVDVIDTIIDKFGTLPTLIGAFAGGLSLFKNTGIFKFDKDTESIKVFGDTLGKFNSTVNEVKSNLSALNVKNGFTSTISKDDISSIRNYVNAINHGVSETTAFNRCMTDASDNARAYAQSGKAALHGVKGFIEEQQAIQVSMVAQNKTLSSAKALLDEYNSGCKTTGMSQKEFANSVAQMNPQLATAMTSTSSVTGGLAKYTASLIGAKVASFALQAATIALNAALTMGISALISWGIQALDKWIVTADELAEKVDDVTSKYKEQHKILTDIKGDYDTTNEDSMISKYGELSKGVDDFGKNLSLTADEYAEYQNIVGTIADQIPSLVSGYDSQGNAILSCAGNVEQLTAAYEELIKKQNDEVLINSSKDINKNFKNAVKDAEHDTAGFFGLNWTKKLGWGDSKLSTQSAEIYENILNSADAVGEFNKAINTEGNDLESFLDNSDIDAMSELLEDAGFEKEGSFWSGKESNADHIRRALTEDMSKVKDILGQYYSDLEIEAEGRKTQAQAALSNALDLSDSMYYGMSDTMKNIARQTVGSFDFRFFANLEEQGISVKTYVDNMLNSLNSLSKMDKASIETAFELRTKFNGGDISYGEYVDGLEGAGKLIDGLVSNGVLDKEIGSQIKLNLGFNEDGIIENYQNVLNRLKDIGLDGSDAEGLLDSLSAEEFSVLNTKIIPEIDAGATREQIEAAIDREMVLSGLIFDLNLEVEAAGIESLNTALTESVTASGLSSESIAALKGRYADLEAQGWDLSSMFEETSHGVHLNREELSKFENELSKQKLAEVNNDLTRMKDEYDKLGEAIKNTKDPLQKSELFNKRQSLAQKISEAATLAAQYEGLTSAYNQWLAAEESGNERDMYENVISGFETVKDELSRGWTDDSTIAFLEMLTGKTDLASKSGKELKEVYDGLGKKIKDTSYSIKDFFTTDGNGNATSKGVYNFLDAIGQLEEEKFGFQDVVKRENGKIIGFDFGLVAKKDEKGNIIKNGDQVIAEALGISEELVQIMVRAADDAGFVISMDGTYKQLADLQNEARTAADYLKEIGKTDFNFDFNTSNVENLTTQLDKAKEILESKEFWNEDGTFNINAKGAEQAMQVVSTLQAKIDSLTKEKYGIGLTVEDKQFEEPLKNLQSYGDKISLLNQLELNPVVNADAIEQLEGELDGIAEKFEGLSDEIKIDIGLTGEDGKALTDKYFDGLSDEKKIELGFVGEDGKPLETVTDAIRQKIESGEVKIPTVLDIQANMDKNIGDLRDLMLLNFLDPQSNEAMAIKIRLGIIPEVTNPEAVDEAVETEIKGTENQKKVELGLDIKGKPKSVDTTEVDETVENDIKRGAAGRGAYSIGNINVGTDGVSADGISEDVNDAVEAEIKGTENQKKIITGSDIKVNANVDTSEAENEVQNKTQEAVENQSGETTTLEKDVQLEFNINDYVDELSKFKDVAKELEGLEDINVTIGVTLNGELDSSKVADLTAFAEGAKTLQGVWDKENSVTVTVSYTGTTDGNMPIENLTVFADGAKALKGIAENTTVNVTANLDGSLVKDFEGNIDDLVTFAKGANDLAGITDEIDVSVTASIGEGFPDSTAISNLEKFATVVNSLPTSAVTVSVNAEVETANINNAISILEKLSSKSGLFKTYEATVTVTAKPASTELAEEFTGKGTITVEPNITDFGDIFKGSGTATMKPNTTDFGHIFSGSGTVTMSYVFSGGAPSGGSGGGGGGAVSVANGTAHVNGTVSGKAFKAGDWGTRESGTALMGELGRELIVRDGRFFTVGDNGAGFYPYKKGDIIFNHKQTEELFKNGYVTSNGGRGTALASGTAFVEGTAFNDGSEGNGGGFWSSSSSSGSSKKKKKKDDEEEFEETLDWIEIKIDRIERAIDQLDTKVSSIYRSWSERNKSLVDQISKIGEEISIQQQAYDKYIQAANDVGLDETYARRVREGRIRIETIDDEDLKEKIDEYKEFYEKALDCKDAILELKETESELYAQRVENVATEYEGILGVIEHEKNVLEEYINQSEAQAWFVSSKYYDALANNERETIIELENQKAEMLNAFNEAMDSGTIAEGSESWYEMVASIDEVTLAIQESKTQLMEYDQTIQQLSWDIFDVLQDKISGVTEETEFLIELLSRDKLHDDNGQLTNEGSATMGLHGVAYNTYMHQADLAAEEIARLKKELEADPFDTELEERYREMVSLQQEYILSAENERDAIKSLVEEGMQLEIEALEERIDKYNEALESEKDLYDYQKKVKEQTKEIASLEKQMAAYQGDDSEEARQKIQQIKVDLEDARANLEETEYDKLIDNSQKLLDNLLIEYEETLNTRLDNIDMLISDMIAEINADAGIIGDTIREVADSVGYTLTDSMKTIWNEDAVDTKNVVTTYGDKFVNAQTTTNNALNSINLNLQNIINKLNEKAKTNVKSASTSSATKSSSSKTTTTKTTTKKSSGGDGKPKIGDRVKYVSGQYYYDSQGKRPLGSHKQGEYVYITNINTRDWATHGYHVSTGNKLGKGDLGWLKLNQISGYAIGKEKFLDDEVAWTQENKKREFIVRPSDGAILTPIANGDSVLSSVASGNIWNMANSPAEFIKNNLGLDASGVPSASNVNSSVVQHFENITFSLPNVHSYNELLREMQSDPKFEKLILSMTIDQIAGKSKLAKGKSIR